nr:hypothetical protein [uncultured Kingella sp.]
MTSNGCCSASGKHFQAAILCNSGSLKTIWLRPIKGSLKTSKASFSKAKTENRFSGCLKPSGKLVAVQVIQRFLCL